jgi:enoyl-CoA hydratase/carnithine racemase
MSSAQGPAAGSPVKIETLGDIAVLTLDRADQRNPLSLELLESMGGALEALDRDTSLRAVVLTGAGSVFCAGAKMNEILDPDGVDGERQFAALRGFNRLALKIRDMDLPVIAAVNGPAVGGGAALALACDFAIAAPEASYFFAFGRVGASGADLGCAYFLPRLVGGAKARQWLLTGASVGAEEGLATGLFVEIHPREGLVARAVEWAQRAAASAPRRALAATKLAVARGETDSLETLLSYEAFVQSFLFTLPDHKERLSAFLKSRKPK